MEDIIGSWDNSDVILDEYNNILPLKRPKPADIKALIVTLREEPTIEKLARILVTWFKCGEHVLLLTLIESENRHINCNMRKSINNWIANLDTDLDKLVYEGYAHDQCQLSYGTWWKKKEAAKKCEKLFTNNFRKVNANISP